MRILLTNRYQSGSFTLAAALFALSVMIITSFFTLNSVRAEDVRVGSESLNDDITILSKSLAIHYQLTCSTGPIDKNDIIGTYIRELNRASSIDDYSLEIEQVGKSAYLTVNVDIEADEMKYVGKAISQGAVLTGNVLTKRSPLTLYQNSRVSVITESNNIERVSNC